MDKSPPLGDARRGIRTLGPACEWWVSRYLPDTTNRGGRRELLFNSVDPAIEAALFRLFGPGRYRIEARDAHRWVVSVKVVELDERGRTARRAPRTRPREVPKARRIPAKAPDGPLIERPEFHAPDDAAWVPPEWPIPGPPSNRADVQAVGAWVQTVVGAVLAGWERLETRCAMVSRAQHPKFLAAASEQIATGRRNAYDVASAEAAVRGKPEASAWVEHLHAWACGELAATKRLAKKARARQRAT